MRQTTLRWTRRNCLNNANPIAITDLRAILFPYLSKSTEVFHSITTDDEIRRFYGLSRHHISARHEPTVTTVNRNKSLCMITKISNGFKNKSLGRTRRNSDLLGRIGANDIDKKNTGTRLYLLKTILVVSYCNRYRAFFIFIKIFTVRGIGYFPES